MRLILIVLYFYLILLIRHKSTSLLKYLKKKMLKAQIHGFLLREEADEEGYVWNMAYGGNIDDKVFFGRRYTLYNC